MDDYRRLGVTAALDAVSKIVPNRKVHAAGYCLGGTLLTIAAATMGRDGDNRLASMTLLASQNDFSDAGELGLFISESQVSYLEHMMWDQGYLDTHQMAGAFHILRSNDLIWSRMVHDYMLGKRKPFNDLMAWNADLTRMPYRMHSEYLRRLFLRNDLATGRYVVDDRPVWFGDIRVPCFAVGTVADHVAPWRSVYKIHLQEFSGSDVCTNRRRPQHRHRQRARKPTLSIPDRHSHFQRPLPRSGFLADRNTIHRRFLVAGMGGLACPAFWRESSATTAGCAAKGIPPPPRCAWYIRPAALTESDDDQSL